MEQASFESDHGSPEAGSLEAAAAEPVPLGDAELDAYLAAEEGGGVQTAETEVSTAVELPTADARGSDGLGSGGAEDGQEQQHEQPVQSDALNSHGAGQHAGEEAEDGATFAEESLEEKVLSDEEGAGLDAEEPGQRSQASLDAADVQHSPQLNQQQPQSAVTVLPAEPPELQETPQAAGTTSAQPRSSSASMEAAASNSHRSSTRSSMRRSNSEKHLPGAQELQDMRQAAGLPASAFSAHRTEPQLYADAAGGPRTSAGSADDSLEGVQASRMHSQHKAKLRPASASPAVHRSSSQRHASSCSQRQSFREQERCSSPRCSFQDQLPVVLVDDWTGGWHDRTCSTLQAASCSIHTTQRGCPSW